ncbi:MAG: hypothetical protein LBV33_04320 [Lachnospiraceae bacterium]|jgi:hypothetical protein|nr:hypothetical protein [Lachnospiraceae bacterium]
MKNKKIIPMVSLILCLVLVPSMTVFAGSGEEKAQGDLPGDNDQLRYVEDIDEYLEQLNAGLITPNNTTITTYESMIMPFGIISDPSESCSNIFGHSWGDWGLWNGSVAYHSGNKCLMPVQRTRYCNRTYCKAYQTESDFVQVPCAH